MTLYGSLENPVITQNGAPPSAHAVNNSPWSVGAQSTTKIVNRNTSQNAGNDTSQSLLVCALAK